MPGQAEISRAALDRTDGLVDIVVNVEAFSLVMAVPLCLRAARLRPRGAKGAVTREPRGQAPRLKARRKAGELHNHRARGGSEPR